MKMLRGFAVLLSLMFTFGMLKAAQAELTTIYGPVYITKAKHDDHDKHGKKDKDTTLVFTAPVAGGGVIIVKNGGESGKRHRAASAEIKLNGMDIADEKDFNKKTDTLRFDVQLLSTNELEIEVESCKECEIELTVLGELPAPAPAPRPLATR